MLRRARKKYDETMNGIVRISDEMLLMVSFKSSRALRANLFQPLVRYQRLFFVSLQKHKLGVAKNLS